ncbi:MAG: hypothetical protein Q8P18_28685 [Pseudomonadota bacterium]|nr:hypothetical protein [Pseudomonadota bacterium]
MLNVEVRRCAACGAAASICVANFQETQLLGLVRTGRIAKRSFVCQACGARFDRPVGWGRVVLVCLSGGAGLGFVVIGLAYGLHSDPGGGPGLRLGGLACAGIAALQFPATVAWSLLPSWRAARNPVVPGAPIPPLRFPLTVPLRRCTAGHPAPCVELTEHQSYGLYLGTSFTHQCPICEERFLVESRWSAVFGFVGGLVFAALGVGMLSTAGGQGAGAWVCASLVLAAGAAMSALFAYESLSGRRHPVVAPAGS